MQKDILLETLIDFVEKIPGAKDAKSAFYVTLTVGGVIISGRICDKVEFWKHHPLSENIWDTWEKADASKKASTAANSAEDDEPERVFIHLADAKYFSPGQGPIPTDGPGVYWRGKLESVHGFSFGKLEIGQPR